MPLVTITTPKDIFAIFANVKFYKQLYLNVLLAGVKIMS